MKIVTWNCNGALREKYKVLEGFNADIIVVQECEDPAQSTKNYASWAGDYLWTGGSKNKGIGVFAKKGNFIESLDWPDGDFQQFLPCRINDQFNLLAVWTMHAPSFQYIGQFWKYFQLNKNLLAGSNTVICGDFNSNVCWDSKHGWSIHGKVVEELNTLGIGSMYHNLKNEPQGKEALPTFFLQRKLEKPYHIDHVFAPESIISGASLEVGRPDQWLAFSDHMPIVFSLDIEKSGPTGETRDLLRKTVWDVLTKYTDQYHYDDRGSGTEYTGEAIMEMWKRGVVEVADQRKIVLLLRKIMFHDRMNSESGNFEFIDEHKDTVEKMLKFLVD